MRTGIYTEEADLTNEGVGSDLERQSSRKALSSEE